MPGMSRDRGVSSTDQSVDVVQGINVSGGGGSRDQSCEEGIHPYLHVRLCRPLQSIHEIKELKIY
jgi:hypothetical protein